MIVREGTTRLRIIVLIWKSPSNAFRNNLPRSFLPAPRRVRRTQSRCTRGDVLLHPWTSKLSPLDAALEPWIVHGLRPGLLQFPEPGPPSSRRRLRYDHLRRAG